MASRASTARLVDIVTASSSRSSRSLLRNTGPSTFNSIHACSCNHGHLQQSRASSTSSAASNPDEAAAVNQADLVKDEVLKASLPFIPEHGFTLSALQEGLSTLRSSSPSSSISSFLSAEPSPMFLEHLFPPSSPSLSSSKRKKNTISPMKIINERNIFKSAEMPFPMNGNEQVEEYTNEEQFGPRKALFEAWLEDALKLLEDQESEGNNAKVASGRKATVLELVQKRLEHNLPVLHHLPAALSTLAKLAPTQPSQTMVRPYLSHVGSIAKQIKSISGSNISTPRLATVYSLSEFYQLSKAQPDLVKVLDYTNDLLKSTEKYDGLIKESVGFVGYALGSWRNIIHSRGM